METDHNYRKLDALFLSVKDRLKTVPYVEVTVHEFRDALQTTLWHLWYGEPDAVLSKAREVARGCGLDFEMWESPGEYRRGVIFRRYGH